MRKQVFVRARFKARVDIVHSVAVIILVFKVYYAVSFSVIIEGVSVTDKIIIPFKPDHSAKPVIYYVKIGALRSLYRYCAVEDYGAVKGILDQDRGLRVFKYIERDKSVIRSVKAYGYSLGVCLYRIILYY